MKIEEIDQRILELGQKDIIVREAICLGLNSEISKEEFLIRLVEVLVRVKGDQR